MSTTPTNDPAPGPAAAAYRYAAFISYRHAEPDRRWAAWLHAALETYRVPGRLRRAHGLAATVGRCFRDEDELAASADLSAEIELALAESRFLIVVCSPRTPGSAWVNREVERFREMGRHDRILALLVEGEPADSFPQALREIRRSVADAGGLTREQVQQIEPLAADVRPTAAAATGGGGAAGHGFAPRSHAARQARLRLIAQVLGVRYDDLWERERRRQRGRRAAWAAAAGVAVAATVGLALLAGRATTAEAAGRLVARHEAAVVAGDFSPPAVANLVALSDELARLDPKAADTRRERLAAAFDAAVAAGLRRPALADADYAGLGTDVDRLAALVPARAAARRAELNDRRRGWQTVAELGPPFESAAKVLHTTGMRAGPTGVEFVRTDNKVAWGKLRQPCGTAVRLDVVFRPPGGPAARGPVAGLGLNSEGDQSYQFLLNGSSMQIVRRGTILAQQELKSRINPGREFRLVATRVGEALTFQVDDQPPLETDDAFPLVKPGEFGVLGVDGQQVVRLRTDRQTLPTRPTPLERGDDLFAAGDAAAALVEYQAQANLVAGGDRRAAEYKVGMCQLALKQPKPAEETFARVFWGAGTEPSNDRWAALAGSQLWLLMVNGERLDDADAVMTELTHRCGRASLMRHVPRDDFWRVLRKYSGSIGGVNLYAVTDPKVEQVRRMVAEAAELVPGEARDDYLFTVVRAYSFLGRHKAVAAVARETLDAEVRSVRSLLIVEDYCWSLRSQGLVREALNVSNDKAGYQPGATPAFKHLLLIERARCKASLGDWRAADEDLKAFSGLPVAELLIGKPVKFYSGDWEKVYSFAATAALLQGFVKEQLGDQDGARAAWARATVMADGSGGGNAGWNGSGFPSLSSGFQFTTAAMLGGLSGKWGQGEGRAALDHLLSIAAGSTASETDRATGTGWENPISALLPKLAGDIPPPAIYELWKSGKGKQTARGFALRQMPLRDAYVNPYKLIAGEIARSTCEVARRAGDEFSGTTKPVPEAAADGYDPYADASGRLVDAFVARQLGKRQLLKAYNVWHGGMVHGLMAGQIGWPSLAPTLNPSVRGPLALVFGRRCLRLDKPAEAETLFKVAVADAPKGSPLAALAAADLARLKATPSRP
jgi:hypothetical protein